MIKSIFIKYMLAFLAIITISFTIFASVISAYIIQFSQVTKELAMASAATAAKQYIENSVQDNFSDLAAELAAYLEFAENSFIFITDTDGQIILHTPAVPANYLKKNYVSEALMREVLDSLRHYRFHTFDGLFAVGHQIFPQYLNNGGEIYGILFYCSPSTTNSVFVSQIIKTIIITCLWILVATMVIIYFMTEKVISPVRAMNRAAKSFALGRFDVRVPVKGGDEIAELAAAFNNMAAAIAANEEKQRSFISNISHDLKTPMQTIRGFIEGILDGTIREDEKEYYLNIVASEISRLARLVTTMFEITRMQTGERKFNKASFDICERARLVIISLGSKIDEKNLEIDFLCDSDKMQVYADADAIHQVLQNLCENAVKFSPERGLIKINIYDRDKKVYISVFNTGEGIPPEDIPFVFDRFYKSDRSRGLDKSGVGLGLFITKTIIDAHEESLQVNSEYGKNCEFIFTLQKIHEISAKKI